MISASTLAQFDVLLPDARVERLRAKLGQELRLPDEVEFATYVQPKRWAVKDGIELPVPPHAVFLVVSPNPHPRLAGQTIRSHAATRLEHWREKEDQKWRFAGVGDPAEMIFRALCIDHLRTRRNYQELN
jgi:hypothetical protein